MQTNEMLIFGKTMEICKRVVRRKYLVSEPDYYTTILTTKCWL